MQITQEQAKYITGYSTWYDWCHDNWGTKWNAYGLDQGGRYKSVAHDGDTLTLTQKPNGPALKMVRVE